MRNLFLTTLKTTVYERFVLPAVAPDLRKLIRQRPGLYQPNGHLSAKGRSKKTVRLSVIPVNYGFGY